MSKTAKQIDPAGLHRLLDLLTGLPPGDDHTIRHLFLWGKPGLGKTEMIRDYALDRGIGFAYCAPAQFEEMGDLHGIPEVEKGETVYRPPTWLPADNGKPGILLLDDFNRADPRIIRGLMQLAQLNALMSWKLPPGWTIVCTGNPDHGDYSTTVLDDAVMTRFIHATIRFNSRAWAEWAIAKGLHADGVNFVLTYPELIENGKLTNARTIASFLRLIGPLAPWNKNADLIETIGMGLLDPETMSTFFSFMSQSADRIPSPEEILFTSDTEKIRKDLLGLLVQPKGIRLDLFGTAFNRLFILCSKPLTGLVNLENLVALFTLEELPNDYRTHMFIEFGKLKNTNLVKVLSDPRIADAMLKAA